MSEAILQPITLSFFVEGIPPSPNRTKGQHWTKLERIKKEWMQRVTYIAQEAKAIENLRGLYETAQVDFHISFGDNRRHDPDNAMWAVAKPTLDALTGVLLEDDSIDNIKLGFSFGREKPRGFRVTITGR